MEHKPHISMRKAPSKQAGISKSDAMAVVTYASDNGAFSFTFGITNDEP